MEAALKFLIQDEVVENDNSVHKTSKRKLCVLVGHWPNICCKNDAPNKGLLGITMKNIWMRYREALMLLFEAENNVT